MRSPSRLLLVPLAITLLPSSGYALTQAAAVARAKRIAWEPVGFSGGGGMFTPAISPADPKLMMINCDMSGAYISENGGRDWRMLNCNQVRGNTRVKPGLHPTNPDVIYTARWGQLLVSRDRGRTFEKSGSIRDSFQGEIAISPDRPGLMLSGGSGGGVYRSVDAGRSWKKVPGPQGTVIGFHFDRTNESRTVFVGTGKGIWRSDDLGATWTEKTNGLPWKEVQGFDGGSSARGRIVILYCTVASRKQNGKFAGGIYRSMDRGESWQWAMGAGTNRDTKMTGQWGAGDISQYVQVLCADARPMTVYVCNTSTGFSPPQTDTVYRSDDGGRTWRLTFFEDPRFRQYNVAPNYVTASTGQCYKGGEAPFGAAICEADPRRIIMTRSQAFTTRDGGTSWFNAHTYPPPGVRPGRGTSWVCNGLVITTTWHYYRDPHAPRRHYIAYTDLGMGRSLDGGRTWIKWEKNKWAPWRNTCYEMVFDPDIPGRIWGAFSNVHDIPNDNIISERHGHARPGGVCVSTDFGESWKVEAKGFPAKPVTSIVLDPRSPRGRRTLYAGVFSEGVYKSTDDGRTWALKKKGLGHPKNMRVYRVILHKDGALFAIICAKRPGRGAPLMREGVGLYRSTDAGESWQWINASRPLLYL
ncbi:MAG: WD40/YVTN/BNR-like repeat-containing protein, partial [Planctomycetota bacterium]